MNISVIGNYESESFRVLLERVRCFFPDDAILDLSRHKGNDWKKMDQNRISDISNSSMVVVCQNWKDHADVIHDLSEAQKHKKDIFIEYEDRFVPLTQQTARAW